MDTLTKNFSKIALCSLIACASAQTFAADDHKMRLNIGLAAGATGVNSDSANAAQAKEIVNDNKFGLGGGALLEVPVNAFFSLQTGAVYMTRKFSVGNSTVSIERHVPTVIVPIEAKLNFANIVTVSAGAFTGIKIGSVTDKVKVGSLSGEFSTGQRKTAEFGLTGAVGVGLPLSELTGIFAEARYNYGLSNAAGEGDYSEKMRDVLVMAGVRISL